MKIFIMLCMITASAFSSEIYITTDGNDTNPGTIQKPLRTLEAARDMIRNHKTGNTAGQKGITIWMRGGTYEIKKSFELTALDSGSKTEPIIYRAFKNEPVRVTGGKLLLPAAFEPVKDNSILQRLRPQVRDKVLQIDLAKQGISDLGTIVPMGLYQPILPSEPELFMNDIPMILARWPNSDWAKTGTVKTDGPVPGAPVEDSNVAKAGGAEISFVEEDPIRWTNVDDIWVFGYWNWDWCDSSLKVTNIDAAKRRIGIAAQPAFGIQAGRRYYAFNILEELDMPSEYYIDRKTGMLYFMPSSDFAKATVVLSTLKKPLISMKNTEYVRFEGITFECTRDTAIQIIGGCGNVIADCTIRNCGNAAVNIGVGADNETVGGYMGYLYANTIWNRNSGTDNGVTGCELYNLGEGGIILGGGDRKTLSRGNNFARDNHIYKFSRRTQTYRPAVSIDGVGNSAMNNLIHDGPHGGIIFYGNDHLVAYNELYNMCMQTGDVGVIYTGRDYTGRGSKISYNYIHDTAGPVGKDSALAIYLDDLTSGIEVVGNVICRVQTGIFIGGGRDNIIKDNLLVGCEGKTIWLDERGLEAWFAHHVSLTDGTMVKRIKAVPYKNEPWLSRYPKLAVLLDDEQVFAPKGNIVEGNSAVNCTMAIEAEIVAKAKQYGQVANNTDAKDADCQDCGKIVNYLRSSLKMRKNGDIQMKNFKQIGPHKNNSKF